MAMLTDLVQALTVLYVPRRLRQRQGGGLRLGVSEAGSYLRLIDFV